MNVEDWEAAALHEIVERIAVEARGARGGGRRLGARRPDARGRCAAAAGAMLRIDGFDASRVLELRLLTDASATQADRRAARRSRPRRRPPVRRRTAKSGETSSSPVACAPRCVSEITPSTRPRTWSGTSSCAAEFTSTTARALAERREERSGDGERKRGRERDQRRSPAGTSTTRACSRGLAPDRDAREHERRSTIAPAA